MNNGRLNGPIYQYCLRGLALEVSFVHGLLWFWCSDRLRDPKGKSPSALHRCRRFEPDLKSINFMELAMEGYDRAQFLMG
jgi:hypothetical protein